MIFIIINHPSQPHPSPHFFQIQKPKPISVEFSIIKKMREIRIKKLEDLKALDISSHEVVEDIDIEITLKLVNQNISFPINIFHSKPNLSSRIFIKIALYGNSKADIPVEILVNEGAKGTSTNFKALVYLMDEKAKANITPGLLIHEKDIASAGHGVVIKNIKEKDTFYLQSRGIEKELAKELIVGIS